MRRPRRDWFPSEADAGERRRLRWEADTARCHRSDHPAACLSDIAARRVDELTVALGGGLACKRGCSHCCHGWITATPGEAENAARAAVATMPNEHLDRLELTLGEHMARLEEISRDCGGDMDRMAAAFNRLGRACVFLSDGTCTIYHARPLQCRVHHSTDAQACKDARARVITGSGDDTPTPIDAVLAGAINGVVRAHDTVWEEQIGSIGRKIKKGTHWNRQAFIPQVWQAIKRLRVLRGR